MGTPKKAHATERLAKFEIILLEQLHYLCQETSYRHVFSPASNVNCTSGYHSNCSCAQLQLPHFVWRRKADSQMACHYCCAQVWCRGTQWQSATSRDVPQRKKTKTRHARTSEQSRVHTNRPRLCKKFAQVPTIWCDR